MRTSAFFAATIIALTSPTVTLAEFLKEGVYEGSATDGGSLRVIIDGPDVGVTVKADGCLGEVEGRLVSDKLGEMYMITSPAAYPSCALSLRPTGKFSFAIQQGIGCSSYHGAACGFGGFVERVR